MKKRILVSLIIFGLICSAFSGGYSNDIGVSEAAQKNSQSYVIKNGKIYNRNYKLVKSRVVTINKKKYYASVTGKVVKNKMFTYKGNKYYSDKKGIIAQSKIFKYKNYKYYAGKKGSLVKKKIVTYKNKKYYAGKNYRIVTNRTITVNGKKYKADKNGVLVLVKKSKTPKKPEDKTTEATTEQSEDQADQCKHDWVEYDDFDESNIREKTCKKGYFERYRAWRDSTSNKIRYGFVRKDLTSYDWDTITCDYPATRYKCSKCGKIKSIFLKENDETVEAPYVSQNINEIDAFKKIYYSDIFGYEISDEWENHLYDSLVHIINYMNHYNLQHGIEPVWFYSIDSVNDVGTRRFVKEGYQNYKFDKNNMPTPQYLISTLKSGKEITESYSYSITPLLAPFNEYFYVKTDNPDPKTILIVDKSSEYTDKEQVLFLCEEEFSDVEYEDLSRYRVKGGYIFKTPSDLFSDQLFDGGDLTVRWKSKYDYRMTEDTDINLKCDEVQNIYDYLEREYTTSDMTVLEKIKSVNDAAKDLAIYPQYEFSKKIKEGYAYLYTPSYDDQAEAFCINSGYPTYQRLDKRMLLYSIYPFMLNSASFPGLISTFARKIEPNVTVELTSSHAYRDITFGGETITVGGQGLLVGSGRESCYLFDEDIKKNFDFEKLSNNQVNSKSKEPLFNLLLEYNTMYVSFIENEPKIEEIQKTINGAAIAKALNYGEGWVKTLTGYSYIYTYEFHGISSDNSGWYYNGYKDTIIDGRYINTRGNYTGDNPPEKYYIFDGTVYPGTPSWK